MGFVVSFSGFRPPPRYNGTTWTEIRIDEAEASTGPWADIDLIELDPLDEDPEAPQLRNLTTENGTLENGWYRLVFLDAATGQSESDPVLRSAPTWRPSLADVGALIRQRTKEAGLSGTTAGTFNEDTAPTGVQVEILIDLAVADLVGWVGADLPADLVESARSAAAMHVAQLVELGFWPEQVGETNLAYQTARMNYEAAAKRILTNTWPRIATGGPKCPTTP